MSACCSKSFVVCDDSKSGREKKASGFILAEAFVGLCYRNFMCAIAPDFVLGSDVSCCCDYGGSEYHRHHTWQWNVLWICRLNAHRHMLVNAHGISSPKTDFQALGIWVPLRFGSAKPGFPAPGILIDLTYQNIMCALAPDFVPGSDVVLTVLFVLLGTRCLGGSSRILILAAILVGFTYRTFMCALAPNMFLESMSFGLYRS